MSGLDGAKSALLRTLFASVSDSALRSIEAALASGVGGGGPVAAAHLLAQAEVRDRRARDRIFAPIAPLVQAPGAPYPASLVADLWRALQATEAGPVAEVAEIALDTEQAERAGLRADALLLLAAERLSGEPLPAWRALHDRLDAPQPGSAERLADILRIAPLLRVSLPRLRVWVRSMESEHGSALRLAFRDASEMEPPMGPVLIAALAAHLQQPWQVLRLISAVMDKPSDAYLAASELGAFGEAVLDDVDARILQVRQFDPLRGAEGGAAVAASVMTAAMQAAEFEQWIEVNREGAWGKRLIAQRRDLARAVELRLKEGEAAVAKALPIDPARLGGRLKGGPKLDAPFDVMAARRAQGLLAFLDGVRACAAFGGFAVVRARVVETLDARLDQYADDLLALIHAGGEGAETVRERLDFAAECLGLVRDPAAAALVRRRAAVAA